MTSLEKYDKNGNVEGQDRFGSDPFGEPENSVFEHCDGSELYGWCEQTLSEEQNRTLGRWNFDISKEIPVQGSYAACEYLPQDSQPNSTLPCHHDSGNCAFTANCPLTGSYTSSRTIVNRAHSASSNHSLGESSSNPYSSANSPWTTPDSEANFDSFDYINDITAHS